MKLMICLFIFLSFNSYAQTRIPSDTVLNWNERKLSWKDFQGSPPSKEVRGMELARTKAIVFSKCEFICNTLRCNVYCQFLISRAWTITASEYSLNHEQKHFDIAEILARKLRKYYNSVRPGSTNEEIDKNVTNLNRKGNLLQKEYDRECNYGLDTLKQKIWNVKIQKMLDTLKAFSQPNR